MAETRLADLLAPERALIFRLTHRANVPWILDHGLHCPNGERDPDFRPIGSAELIGKRAGRAVPEPPGGTLADYVPFYFTPCSPMMLNIVTGYGIERVERGELAVLVSSHERLRAAGVPFLYTDRHVYMNAATFFRDEGGLPALPWADWRTSDFRSDPERPDKMERYQAETPPIGPSPSPRS